MPLPGRQIATEGGQLTDAWLQYLSRVLAAAEVMSWQGPGRPPAVYVGQAWVESGVPIFVRTPGRVPVWVNAGGVVV